MSIHDGQGECDCDACLRAQGAAAERARPIDWSERPTEQIIAASAAIPVVLGPWKKWGFANGWSRAELPVRVHKGDVRYVSVQPGTGVDYWTVNLDGAVGSGLTAPDEESAKRLADETAVARGWRLFDGGSALADAIESGAHEEAKR